jgi:hypothetical protein
VVAREQSRRNSLCYILHYGPINGSTLRAGARFTQAERQVRVHGQRGVVRVVPCTGRDNPLQRDVLVVNRALGVHRRCIGLFFMPIALRHGPRILCARRCVH